MARLVLVPNPIDRYSIGDRTPGDFRPVMRMYWPDQPVLDGGYELPPARRVG